MGLLRQQSDGSASWVWLIGQAAPPSNQRSVDILIILAIVVALAVVVVIAALIIRRIMLGPKDAPTLTEGFSLSDLRQLRREGQITEEELAAAKTLIIARSRSALEGDQHSDPGSGLAYRQTSSWGEDGPRENFSDPDSDKNSEADPPPTSRQ